MLSWLLFGELIWEADMIWKGKLAKTYAFTFIWRAGFCDLFDSLVGAIIWGAVLEESPEGRRRYGRWSDYWLAVWQAMEVTNESWVETVGEGASGGLIIGWRVTGDGSNNRWQRMSSGGQWKWQQMKSICLIWPTFNWPVPAIGSDVLLPPG